MINKVTKKECLDAIEYLYGQGFIENMSRDQQRAVEILLKKVANEYKLKLYYNNIR